MTRISQRSAALLSLSAMLLVCGGFVHAQTATGQVSGTITDPTGAPVPNARVTLHNEATNIETKATSAARGFFTIPNVAPGTYTLRVENPGFKTARVPEFIVAVNQTVAQDIVLSLGQVSESVEVKAEAQLLQSSSAELGTVINEKAVNDLPLNGRNFTQLLTLTPGATPVSTAQGSSVGFQDAGISGIPNSSFSKPSLNGQENRSTLYYMDGIFNTDLRGPVYGFLPIIDLIQEFKVQSHNDKAEYGGVTGGVVNVVSKSGTNQVHGSAWEFVRNDFFDARNEFTDVKGPAPFRQNEFGAAAGGPIIKNKTFFYGGYEGWRYRKPNQSFGLVPTDAELNGDFSLSTNRQAIFNPFSTRPDPTRPGQFIRDRFMCDGAGNPLPANSSGIQGTGTPCNKIPQSLLSPVVQGFLKTYLQSPNYVGDPSQNFLNGIATQDDGNDWQVKVDHTFSEKDNVFFRWSQIRVHHIEPLLGVKAFQPSDYVGNNWGGGYIHLFSPNLIADVRGGYLSKPYDFNQAQSTVGVDAMKKLGFRDIDRFGGLVMNLAAPFITGDVGNRGISKRRNPDWNITGNLNWIKGNHNVKAGYEYINVQRDQINTFQSFGFSNTPTGNPSALGTTGSSVASALLAFPTSYQGQLPDFGEVHFGLGTWSAYLQDEWKVKPRVTVNLGLRYDVLTQPYNIDTKRLSNALDIKNQLFLIGAKTLPPLCGQTQQNPCLPGTGLAGIPFSDHIKLANHQNFQPQPVYDNVGPRVGIAWQVNSKTVFRSAYGLYWDALPARSQYTQNDIEGASWPWTTGFGPNTVNNVGSPLQTITSIEGSFPFPTPAASPWTAVSGAFLDDPNYKDGYSHQYNVEIQRQLSTNWLISTAYVGSVNRRLAYTGYANAAPTPSPNGTSAAAIDALRPMPWVVANIHYTRAIGSSHYNSLQVKLDRRFAAGLQMLVSYTYSKSIDNTSGYFGVEDGAGSRSSIQNFFDPNSNRGPSGFDIPHFLSWFTVYEFPAGHGKRWLQSGPASWILGGWRINSIFQARTGQPFNIGVNGDVANIGGTGPAINNYERPNLTGNPIPAHQSASLWFDPKAFAIPNGAFGNFGRNVLRTANVWNEDASLIKNTSFGERMALEFRFEAFNVFNHANLGAPSTNQATITPSNAGVGRINSLAGGTAPRELQLAMKFVF